MLPVGDTVIHIELYRYLYEQCISALFKWKLHITNVNFIIIIIIIKLIGLESNSTQLSKIFHLSVSLINSAECLPQLA